jgi:nucleotide-binding universal stress UspA family protein
MFKHILVPLDGSRLAEAALSPAAYLAQKLRASVTLIHIIERDAPEAIHGERHLTNPEEAYAYLDEVAQNKFPAEANVERHVHTEQSVDVARSIIDHVDEFAPDLIVMCTHGRGGLRDVLYGSIAQQVVAGDATPVLLVQPAGPDSEAPFACRRLLIPLDALPEHEEGLHVAAELAFACQAQVHLMLVVPTLSTLSGAQAAAGRLLPGSTTQVLELTRQDAEAYLLRHTNDLQAKGLSVEAEICRGDPVTNIIEVASKTEPDLIVLGTHGKTGMDAFWSGSVAPRVSSRSSLPLLLVPVPRPQAMEGNQ